MDRPATADYPPGARLPSRELDDFEFVWILRGRARLVSAEGEVELTTSRLALIPPGLRHAIEWDPARATRHGYVHFTALELDRDLAPRLRVVPMGGQDPLAGLCGYLRWLGSGESPDWYPAARRTLGFLVDLVERGPLPEIRSGPALGPVLEAAVRYLRTRWAQLPLHRVGVAELAAAIGVSRGYLNRRCHDAFGHGAAGCLERLRMSRAEVMLTRTDLTADSIGRQCGFADLSHFSHRFTALHGVSPSAYRTLGRGAPSVADEPGVRRLAGLLWS